jgi:excisionase family DNA binding protein
MTQPKERPIRAPDDLLSVDDAAERLLASRAAVYRLVALRRLPFYRLPSGIRFKEAEVEAFLNGRRIEARPSRSYGSPKA